MPTVEAKAREFTNPPVIETVLGVAFAPLAGWDIPHFGLYWAGIRKDYPSFSVQHPLLALPGGGSEQRPEELLPLASMVRCWFVTEDETGLLQVQRDRFIRNWKKAGEDDYPHYEATRPLFERDWVQFCAFLAREGLGVPEVRQCEVTYINHIPQDAGDWSAVFPCWSGKTSLGLMPGPDALSISVRYPIPDGSGHVSLVLQPAIRNADQQRIYQLSVSAKGKPPSSTLADIVAWFDLGREWASRAFKDFTSTRMHAVWAGKRENV